MAANSEAKLQEKVRALEARLSNSKQLQVIQELQRHLQERELVVDVLKGELCKASGQTPEEINALLVKKTIGAPLRFRPATREELASDVHLMEGKLRAAGRALDTVEARVRKEKARGDALAGTVEGLRRQLAASPPPSDLNAQLHAFSDLELRTSELAARYSHSLSALTSVQGQLASSKAREAQLVQALRQCGARQEG